MKWTIAPPALMGAGLLLMIAGFIWPRVVGSSVWSEKQAQRLSTAGADVHRLQYQHAFATDGESNTGGGGQRRVEQFDDNPQPSTDRIKAELDQAREDWDQAKSELERARKMRSVPSHVLWWLGVVSCFLGVAGYFVLRTEWAQQYVEA
jgi:hypothetical protein